MENRKSEQKEIWLAGGCFWGVEAYLKKIEGVINTTVGYANGNTLTPGYYDIPRTGHSETVHVIYDPVKINLETLLKYYFTIIDPTLLNRQGPDKGTQYRTGIYYKDEEDLSVIKQAIKNEQNKYTNPIVTETLRLQNFYPAEEYHRNYLDKNPQGYCHIDLSIKPDLD